MLHVSADQMAGRQSTAEGQLASQDSSGNDACEALGVGAWAGWVRATDAEHVEHGTLRVEDGAAA
jgi:hypothetical protein